MFIIRHNDLSSCFEWFASSTYLWYFVTCNFFHWKKTCFKAIATRAPCRLERHDGIRIWSISSIWLMSYFFRIRQKFNLRSEYKKPFDKTPDTVNNWHPNIVQNIAWVVIWTPVERRRPFEYEAEEMLQWAENFMWRFGISGGPHLKICCSAPNQFNLIPLLLKSAALILNSLDNIGLSRKHVSRLDPQWFLNIPREPNV